MRDINGCWTSNVLNAVGFLRLRLTLVPKFHLLLIIVAQLSDFVFMFFSYVPGIDSCEKCLLTCGITMNIVD